MRLQRLTQAATLLLFLFLLTFAAHPLEEGVPFDLLLRLDPLICLGTLVTCREALWFLLPGLIVLSSALVLGRWFCGHVCPMGTTLDMAEVPIRSGLRLSAKDAPYDGGNSGRSWKYLGLAAILGAALGGISLVHLGSPLSLVTRLYGIVVYPIVNLVGDGALAWLGPWLSRLGFHGPAGMTIPQRVFAANFFVAVLFVCLAMLAYKQPRFWCRNLCPAGALFALCSRSPLIRRNVSESCTRCGRCVRACPTGAIGSDPTSTAHSECIVCLRCVEICPESAISFDTGPRGEAVSLPAPDPTRRGILAAVAAGLTTAGLLRTGIRQPRAWTKERAFTDPELIRPPGALPEPQFLERCVRCGECMKACPTNTLQPVWLKAGLEGLFTPVITPRLAACAVHCNVCGKVCPTGAIRDLPLVEKQHAKVGTAWIIRQNCLVWEQDKRCLVCDEVCPYKAISFQKVPDRVSAVPFVIENRCLGCGWCETRCPVAGASAIRVNIIGELRLVSGSYRAKAEEYGLVFQEKEPTPRVPTPDALRLPEPSPRTTPDTETPEPGTEGLPPGFISK